MPVYWSMLFVTVVIAILNNVTSRNSLIVVGKKRYKTQYVYALFTFLYILFWIGLRDKVLDTGEYINSFNLMPGDWENMLKIVSASETGKGFYFIQGVFKNLISDNHYVWLMFLGGISCLCLMRTLYKYSVDFSLSAFLFIASTEFTWLLNGTRQFLVVCIMVFFADWLIEGRKMRYMLLALLMSTIHSSAIFLAPICLFVSSDKLFDKKMLVFVILTVMGTNYSENVFEFIDEGLGMDYAQNMVEGSGSNIIRLFVAAVPLVIVVIARKRVKQKADRSIILAVNMLVVGICFYFASTFTDGILIGRMPIYFTIYSLYLLPWLIKNCFSPRTQRIVLGGCFVLYLIYFYYQMEVAWGGLMYVSDILNLTL